MGSIGCCKPCLTCRTTPIENELLESLVNKVSLAASMGLCELVVALVDALAQAKSPLQARHRLLIDILRLMPLYCEAISNLTAWETAFQDAHPRWTDDSEVGEMIEKIFELGRYNMHARGSTHRTWMQYRTGDTRNRSPH